MYVKYSQRWLGVYLGLFLTDKKKYLDLSYALICDFEKLEVLRGMLNAVFKFV